MSTRSRSIRFLATGAVLVLAATAAVVVLFAQPAAAQPTFTNAPRLTWTYTDSRDAHTSFTAGATSVFVGSWRDEEDKHHISRSYLTYDLTPYAGKTIISASLFLRDDKTTDCAVRALAIWETELPAVPPTWANPPADLTQLGSLGASACPGVAGVDVSAHVRAAIGDGQQRMAIEIRVPDTEPGEGDIALGRLLSRFAPPRLVIGYNTPPVVVDQHLYNDGRPCDTESPYSYLGGADVQLGAMLDDEDANTISLAGEFAIWPVDNPDQRTVITRLFATRGFVNNVTVTSASGVLVNGVTYAWAARATDGIDVSPWSRTCFFHYDSVRPASAPGVVSANYPEGQVSPGGRTPSFTFTANGTDDVAAYQYSFTGLSTIGFTIGPFGIPQWSDPFDSAQFVRADGLGGSASVTVPFPSDGPLTLLVRSYDRAYQSGPTYRYELRVTNTSPTVTVVDGPARPGVPLTLAFAKHADVIDVIDYTYRLNSGPTQTTTAEPDGSASATVTLPSYDFHSLEVTSRSSNGWVSSVGRWTVFLDNTPTVTSPTYPESGAGGGPGVEGSFTFHPGAFGAESYVYSFDFGPEQTVEAASDGSATVTFTPDTPFFHRLEVRAVDAAGIPSSPALYVFEVADLTTPRVTSDIYPQSGTGGGVGVTGTFTFHPGSVVGSGYAYSFDFSPEQTVAAGQDGTASVTFTPDVSGFHELYVYVVDENGIPLTNASTYAFFVNVG